MCQQRSHVAHAPDPAQRLAPEPHIWLLLLFLLLLLLLLTLGGGR
jgi:hypothetical protein